MQADRSLARARGALDAHGAREVGAHDDVLLGLDRGDDVAHGADPWPLDLGLQDRGVLLPGISEERLVLVAGESPAHEAVAPTLAQPERLGPRRAVERTAHRSSPVHDHGVAGLVGDVSATDVQALAADVGRVRQVVDPAEEQRDGRVVGQGLAALGEGRLQELPAHPVAGGCRVEALGAGAHPGQGRAGLVEVRLLGGEVVGVEAGRQAGVEIGIAGRICGRGQG